MSGDSAGIVIGGALLLGAIPVVVGGALAIGAVYATVRAGAALFRVGKDIAREHGQRKTLEAQQCSAELSGMYAQMESALREQERQYGEISQRMGAQLTASSEALQRLIREENKDEGWTKRANQARQQAMEEMTRSAAGERQRIRQQTAASMAQIEAEMQRQMETQQGLIEWESSRAEDRAHQRAMCGKLLRDAEATLRICRALGSMEEKADLLASSLSKARRHFDDEIYDACAAESQDIITTGARLAAEISQKTLETDIVRQEILARCEGLQEYMARCRRVTFLDEFFQEEITEDLNAFSQGRYEEIQAEIDAMIDRLNRENRTEEELTLIEEELDSVLTPNAQLVCETARDQLLAYYERLHTMEKLADYMRTQNYELDWACHPGDDQTQKLTVRFVNRATNNSVVLTLDRDMSTEDLHRMLVDLHIFYQNGRPMTEAEKEALRKGLTGALEGSCVRSSLACTGNKNLPSDQTRLQQEADVRNTRPVRLFQDGD